MKIETLVEMLQNPSQALQNAHHFMILLEELEKFPVGKMLTWSELAQLVPDGELKNTLISGSEFGYALYVPDMSED